MLFTAIKLNHLRDNKQNDKPIRLLHFFCQLSVNHDCCVISLAIVRFSFIDVDTGCVSAKLSLYLVALPSRFFFEFWCPNLILSHLQLYHWSEANFIWPRKRRTNAPLFNCCWSKNVKNAQHQATKQYSKTYSQNYRLLFALFLPADPLCKRPIPSYVILL